MEMLQWKDVDKGYRLIPAIAALLHSKVKEVEAALAAQKVRKASAMPFPRVPFPLRLCDCACINYSILEAGEHGESACRAHRPGKGVRQPSRRGWKRW